MYFFKPLCFFKNKTKQRFVLRLFCCVICLYICVCRMKSEECRSPPSPHSAVSKLLFLSVCKNILTLHNLITRCLRKYVWLTCLRPLFGTDALAFIFNSANVIFCSSKNICVKRFTVFGCMLLTPGFVLRSPFNH